MSRERRIWPAYRKFLGTWTVEGVLLMQEIDAQIVIAIAHGDPEKKARAHIALGIIANETPPASDPVVDVTVGET
jgi:hypothetical protein